MRIHGIGFWGAACVLWVAGCGGPAVSAAPQTGPTGGSTASLVLLGNQLRSGSGNLLAALAARVRSLRVRQTNGTCPAISLRGTHSLYGSSDPAIYVDGVRTANTCVLDELYVAEVSRVEIYPMGIAPSPPYKAHPNGLILVFMERSNP